MKQLTERKFSVIEFFSVMTLSFGAWIVPALRIILQIRTGKAIPSGSVFNDKVALQLVGFEVVVLVILFIVGKVRGWSFRLFGLQVSWKLTCIGLLLFMAIDLPAVAWIRASLHFTGTITWPVLATVIIINPFFEEAMEVGYVVFSLERLSLWLAIFVSAAVRAFVHIYAGWTVVAYVFVSGLIVAAVYARWRQLWPLLVFHCLADLAALYPLLHVR